MPQPPEDEEELLSVPEGDKQEDLQDREKRSDNLLPSEDEGEDSELADSPVAADPPLPHQAVKPKITIAASRAPHATLSVDAEADKDKMTFSGRGAKPSPGQKGGTTDKKDASQKPDDGIKKVEISWEGLGKLLGEGMDPTKAPGRAAGLLGMVAGALGVVYALGKGANAWRKEGKEAGKKAFEEAYEPAKKALDIGAKLINNPHDLGVLIPKPKSSQQEEVSQPQPKAPAENEGEKTEQLELIADDPYRDQARTDVARVDQETRNLQRSGDSVSGSGPHRYTPAVDRINAEGNERDKLKQEVAQPEPIVLAKPRGQEDQLPLDEASQAPRNSSLSKRR